MNYKSLRTTFTISFMQRESKKWAKNSRSIWYLQSHGYDISKKFLLIVVTNGDKALMQCLHYLRMKCVGTGVRRVGVWELRGRGEEGTVSPLRGDLPTDHPTTDDAGFPILSRYQPPTTPCNNIYLNNNCSVLTSQDSEGQRKKQVIWSWKIQSCLFSQTSNNTV